MSEATDRPGRDLTEPLTDPDFYAGDPFPHFARLREAAPLTWHDDPAFWAVSTHAEVLAISRDPETFCSGRGILLRDLTIPMAESPGALLYVDPPEHGRYRKLVQPAFAPSRIRALEATIRRRTADLLDGIGPGAGVEIVGALAVPLPILVIADLLGVPEDRAEDVARWTDALIALATDVSEEHLETATEMAAYFTELIAKRSTEPHDDLISTLVHVEVDGERLDHDELMMFCGQLLVAGNETTRNLISAGLWALAEHPDQWTRLRSAPDAIPLAVEELLRWTTPVTSFLRTATRDVVVGGQQVAAGEALLLLYASANRDEAVFGPTADRLDLWRDPNPQLSFGFGEHFCIGAALARLEGRVVLEELAARVTTIEPDGELQRLPSTVIAGVTAAPLRFG